MDGCATVPQLAGGVSEKDDDDAQFADRLPHLLCRITSVHYAMRARHINCHDGLVLHGVRDFELS